MQPKVCISPSCSYSCVLCVGLHPEVMAKLRQLCLTQARFKFEVWNRRWCQTSSCCWEQWLEEVRIPFAGSRWEVIDTPTLIVVHAKTRAERSQNYQMGLRTGTRIISDPWLCLRVGGLTVKVFRTHGARWKKNPPPPFFTEIKL